MSVSLKPTATHRDSFDRFGIDILDRIQHLKIGDFTVSSTGRTDRGKLRSKVIHLKKVQNTLDGVLPSVSARQHELAAIGWKHKKN